MTLSTLREDAAEKAERLAHLEKLIKLVDTARDAVEAADLYAWSKQKDGSII